MVVCRRSCKSPSQVVFNRWRNIQYRRNNEKTNLEVVETICDLLEELAPIKPDGLSNYKDLITFVEDRPGHDKRYAIDATKISQDLNWFPVESFESGLRKTVSWYLENTAWWEKILSDEYKLERIGESNE